MVRSSPIFSSSCSSSTSSRVLCRHCATETCEVQVTFSMPNGTPLSRGQVSLGRSTGCFFFTKLHLVLLLELELIISHTSTPYYSIGLTETSSMCLLQSGVRRGKSICSYRNLTFYRKSNFVLCCVITNSP